MKKRIISILLAAMSTTAFAIDVDCNLTGTCQNQGNESTQKMGDIKNESGALNSSSQSSSSNNTSSSTSTSSGNTHQANNQSQTSQSNQYEANNAGNASVGDIKNSNKNSASAGNTSSNNSTGVSVGGSSYSYKGSVFIPPVVPPTPPTSLAVGNIVSHVTSCGPLQEVNREHVKGVIAGFFTDTEVSQGHDDYLVEHHAPNGEILQFHRRDNPDGTYSLFGHQTIETTAIVGVGSAKNLAIGGGSSNGSWGQGGGGVSGTNQQLVTTIRLRYCIYGTFTQAEPVPPPHVYIDMRTKPEPRRIYE